VAALSGGGVDGISLLAAEGLLNALLAEPQRIAGQELLDFVANVEIEPPQLVGDRRCEAVAREAGDVRAGVVGRHDRDIGGSARREDRT